MSDYKTGDKVKWEYTHHLNSRASVRKVKYGVFVADIQSRKVDGGIRKTFTKYCRVRFDGNSADSRVLISELQGFK